MNERDEHTFGHSVSGCWFYTALSFLDELVRLSAHDRQARKEYAERFPGKSADDEDIDLPGVVHRVREVLEDTKKDSSNLTSC